MKEQQIKARPGMRFYYYSLHCTLQLSDVWHWVFCWKTKIILASCLGAGHHLADHRFYSFWSEVLKPNETLVLTFLAIYRYFA